MLTLAPILASYQQIVEKLDDNSNISVSELEELGIPADFQEKIREIGAHRVSLVKEQLEIDLKWLKDIAEDQKYIPVLAVPQEKFAKFLIEDIEENLADLQERRWFYRCIAPDVEKQLKKHDTHQKAQMSKRSRLLKAYKRYIPIQNEKMVNLIAKKEAQLNEVQKRIDILTAEADRLHQDRLEKEAIIARLTDQQASLPSSNEV